ncbi:MAG: RecX family transcriptional regulator, partial [Clostridia bacterium]|nr:RecX family transcriptional regulator [Clostridia bacterium]
MTSSGLKTALMRKGYLAPVAEAVCERLTENRLIDDKRFAERFVELRQDGAVGRYALKRRLRAKGVDEETASEALEQLDDDSQLEAAVELARRLARRYAGEDAYAARGKLSQALARRGY